RRDPFGRELAERNIVTAQVRQQEQSQRAFTPFLADAIGGQEKPGQRAADKAAPSKNLQKSVPERSGGPRIGPDKKSPATEADRRSAGGYSHAIRARAPPRQTHLMHHQWKDVREWPPFVYCACIGTRNLTTR